MITFNFYNKGQARLLHKLYTGEEQAKEFYHRYYTKEDNVIVHREDDTADITSDNFRRKMIWD